MNNTNHKIDPSIAFCTKSAPANFNNHFDDKAVIYRKLINSFCDCIEKDCYIAIDTNQQPEQGDLTLFEFGKDTERLSVFSGESDAFGKLIAYSAVNDLSEFFTLQTIKTDEMQTVSANLAKLEQPQTTSSHLTEITPDDINRFSEALKTLLDSGLFNAALWKDLYQLRSSLDTFESLLTDKEEIQNIKGAMQ